MIYIMGKRHQRQSDGLYHVGGKTFKLLRGTRAQVWHGTALETQGRLRKHQLMMNKHGRIVSKKKHNTAKREKTPSYTWLGNTERQIRRCPRWQQTGERLNARGAAAAALAQHPARAV